MRIAHSNHLIRARNRRKISRQRGGFSIQQDDRIKTHRHGNPARQRKRASRPQRQQSTRHDRGIHQKRFKIKLTAAQLTLQIRSLLGEFFDTFRPQPCRMRQQTRLGARHMGVVRAAETSLNIAQLVAVKNFFGVLLQKLFKCGLPPRKFEFRCHLGCVCLTLTQLVQKIAQSRIREPPQEYVTFGQAHEHFTVGEQSIQAGFELVKIRMHKVDAFGGIGEYDLKPRKLRAQRVQGVRQSIQVLGNLRGAGRIKKPNPLGALGLHNFEMFMQIANMHSRQNILFCRSTQARTLHTAHVDTVFPSP